MYWMGSGLILGTAHALRGFQSPLALHFYLFLQFSTVGKIIFPDSHFVTKILSFDKTGAMLIFLLLASTLFCRQY